MSSEAKMMYQGVEIVFREDDDVWRAYSLDMEHQSLKALKKRIAQYHLDMRRLPNVAVIYMDEYGGSGERFQKHVVTSITEDGKGVWVTPVKSAGSWQKQRATRSPENLALDTPETRRDIAEYNRLAKEAEAARKLADTALKNIKRTTIEDFKAIAGQRLDEEETGAA